MTVAELYRAQRARCPRLPARDALAEVRAAIAAEGRRLERDEERRTFRAYWADVEDARAADRATRHRAIDYRIARYGY